MFIKTLQVGPIETNCYIVADSETKKCAIIDPGEEGSYILDTMESLGLECACVMLTHAHFDHVGAVEYILEETGAPLYMNAKDNNALIGSGRETFSAPKGTVFYKEGDTVCVGGLTFEVLETPGHTPGCVVLRCGEALFTGDTLFRDSCGRTDFGLSNTEQMMESLRRIAALEGDYEVYPGHMFSTTLDRERRYNYFMLMAMNGK
ncbi:MAG: MBL fold metallo-hydrolase [Oscillospiraceae bacterium]|nr:MBL fold metallo-hydrolase [Oscillospiraceae bacterium]MBR5260988.1 MBL fold metallo-hydrolase [Oscillospiraceae bacterium]